MAIGIINYGYGTYRGTKNDIKKEFHLKYNNVPIFQRFFDGSNSSVVNISNNTIRIPNHFYVTGEEIEYSYLKNGLNQPIGIANTFIPGIGNTDILPSKLYAVKVNDLDIKVAPSAADALKSIPNILDITSVGIGSSHIFTSKNQNKKVVITIDNLIQSPIVSTSSTALLTKNVTFFDGEIFVSEISQFYSGDFLKINNEIVKVTSVGVGSTNSIFITRPYLGTSIGVHSLSSLVTKVIGNYNIINNTIYFADAPYGKVPIPNEFNPDEVDYVGISTGSSFSGRVFLRSAFSDTLYETYSNNYIFDGISDQFDGYTKSFSLKSNNTDVTGISQDNAVVLINSIFQAPSGNTNTNDYDLAENLGITTITFAGSAVSTSYDVNTANIPKGGIIVSVGSSTGLGYQPLVSAGGTAIVSIAGTIQSISIGNSGSGYRVGIQTIVNVGVRTDTTSISNIQIVGTATVNNGHIVGVSITNPGSGYTSTNPPIVVFDPPLSYSNIPLIYSTQSNPGIGTGAVVDIIVGQGSSVISFDIVNYGYGYKKNELLTIDIGGTSGIPTNTSLPFSEFQILVDQTQTDQFSAWTIGSLQVIDPIDNLFDGSRKIFPIRIGGNQTTIRAKKGSNIDVKATLLIFINDILQVPGKSYIFNGGSTIRFTEPPNEGDRSKIIFYRGTDQLDTLDVDILETIKIGDTVELKSDDINFDEDDRLVTEIISSDVIRTNLYGGIGVSRDENLLRPLTWCRQTEDLVVEGNSVSKDRIIYEPFIQPLSNIITNVGISDTYVFVESVKGFFDSEREYLHNGTTERPQNKIIIISQDTVVSASATAVVSTSGTISSVVISDGGVGYTTDPVVSIGIPNGISSITPAQGIANIVDGSVSSVLITDGGSEYDQSSPPSVLFESPIPKYEIIDNITYQGDFGVIVGIETTLVGLQTAIQFDLFIPPDSILRDTKIVRSGICTLGISALTIDDYFVVRRSNVGNGVTSLDSSGSVIGIGTSFVDNIYQPLSVEYISANVSGIGITDVTRILVHVSDYNGLDQDLIGVGVTNFYGEYSWGKLSSISRRNPKEFLSYNISGISTSPVVQRFNRLKYIGYSTT